MFVFGGCYSDSVYKEIMLSNISTNRTTGLISVSIFRLVDDVMQPGLARMCVSLVGIL